MNSMNSNKDKWRMVIGLEVHVQLSTKTKMFTSSEWSYGESPNTQICPITLGYPGSLPTINKSAVKKGIMIGLSLNCDINKETKFARKHYFYPDLPKGYQISQFDDPLCENGYLNINNKRINIVRAHLEEDAGKSIHTIEGDALIDYNRAGAPLLEIVSGPDMSSGEDAIAYLNFLKETIIALKASDCDMEKGNLRVDLNVSIMRKGTSKLGTRREVKNINSFRNVEKAIDYEFEYQCDVLNNDGEILQETLLWDDNSMKTKSIRSKEDAHDYRYFPEPDLPPLQISDELISKLASKIPELPFQVRDRLSKSYALSDNQIDFLIRDRSILGFFEMMAKDSKSNSVKYYNWLTIEVIKYLKDTNQTLESFSVDPTRLKELVDMEIDKKIDHANAKKIFSELTKTTKTAKELFVEMGFDQKDDLDDMELLIESVFDKFPDEFKRLENGEVKLINFFIGMIMKESKGKYLPANITNYLKKNFDNS